MKVKALGERDMWVGYYGMARRRGGDVFLLNDPKDFSKQWMMVVEDSAPESKPGTFNKVGQGIVREVQPPVVAPPETVPNPDPIGAVAPVPPAPDPLSTPVDPAAAPAAVGGAI